MSLKHKSAVESRRKYFDLRRIRFKPNENRILFRNLIQVMFPTKIKKYRAQWLSRKKIIRNQPMMKQEKK